MGQGVDVGAHVASQRERVRGGTVSCRAHIIAVLLHQSEKEWRMRGVMRHAGKVGLGQIENPRASDGFIQWLHLQQTVPRYEAAGLMKPVPLQKGKGFSAPDWGKLHEYLGMRCMTDNTILSGRTMTNEDTLVHVDGGKSFFVGSPDWVEVEFREFQAISDRANRLLSREGDFDVAFKKSISGLESDDFVSFANSKKGGAILIGVDPAKHGKGRRRASLVGCPVGDRERLKILAKSSQCVPPVTVSIFVENCGEKPFYRIEIPSGPHKPYCTLGGTYKTRGDGRNEVLYPAQLLALFLETEGQEFVRWFQQSTTSLGSAVQETKQRIATQRKHRDQSVWDTQSRITDSLEALSEAASHAEGNAEDAGAFAQRAGECDVRLSSQDLCGFLMRLP
jgi:hypothetical protein